MENKVVRPENIPERIIKEVRHRTTWSNEDLGINPTTFNMWCKGNSMPYDGKIQKLADYFGIGKSDLTDLKESKEPDKEYADITLKIALYDERFKKIIIEYSKLPSAKKDLLCDFFETFIF